MKSLSQRWVAVAFGLASIVSGCAHSQLPRTDLKVDVRQGEAEDMILVQVTNIIDEARCLRSELVRNPDTASAHIDGRLNGRRLPGPPDGYLIPQLIGLETLEPGESVAFKLNIATQSWEIAPQSSDDILEVKVAVESLDCSTEAVQQRTFSQWTRLVE